jgi:hypothetical protein
MKYSLQTLFFLFISSICFAQTDVHKACFQDVKSIETKLNPLAGVSVSRVRTTPNVVAYNATTPILLEANITGTPSEAKIEFVNLSTQLLNDKGTNGDKKSGDGIFSAMVLPPTTGWEAFLGYLKVSENGVQVTQTNLFVLILTKDMPIVKTRKIDAKTQFSDYVFNYVIPSTGDVPASFETLSKEFYKYHPDDFDFLNFVLLPGYSDNRFHSTVNNAVQGIGQKIINANVNYGSKAKLLGFNYFPVPSFFDPANKGYNHEIGHQWINYFSNSFLKDGVPHWPASNLSTGVMGISIGGVNGAGGDFNKTFTLQGDNYVIGNNPITSPIFNDWELYLMGLIPAKDVQTTAIIFKNQAVYPNNGTYPKSSFNFYLLSDLITLAGERIPNESKSQKQFTIGTIVLSETQLSDEEMSYFNAMSQRAESKIALPVREGLSTYTGNPFYLATQGKATLRALLNTNFNCATVPARPNIIADNGLVFCGGSSVVLKGGTTTDTYIWYLDGVPNNTKTNSLSASIVGNYSVSVRDENGCNSAVSSEVKVTQIALPVKPTVVADGSTTVYAPQKVKLTATTSESVKFQWQKDNVDISNATQAIYEAVQTGNYAVKVTNNLANCSSVSNSLKVEIQQILGNAQNEPIPDKVELSNFPNPFENTTQIKFALPNPSKITLKIYGQNGKEISKLTDGFFGAGWHSIQYDATNLSSGNYLYKLETEQGVKVEKMLVVK